MLYNILVFLVKFPYYMMEVMKMPQLSLYIDQDTMKKVEKAAKLENVSLSKWVCKKLKSVMIDEWPDNYFELFGSITDPSFKYDKKLSFKNDNKRELL